MRTLLLPLVSKLPVLNPTPTLQIPVTARRELKPIEELQDPVLNIIAKLPNAVLQFPETLLNNAAPPTAAFWVPVPLAMALSPTAVLLTPEVTEHKES
jgi:hypothetical protein